MTEFGTGIIWGLWSGITVYRTQERTFDMYKIQEIKEKIINCLKDLERHAIFSNRAGRFDLNKDAEEFYRDLLNLFFDWNLKNLNTDKNSNYEGADLGDVEKGIAVQVTSENNSEKVHNSVKGFKNKSLRQGYKELYILMFEGKSDFPRANFAKTVDGTFIFDKFKHIIDHSDLCAKLKDAEYSYLKAIYDYLDEIVGLSYSGLDEGIDDLGIVNEIFDYIQKNKPKKATYADTIIDSSGIDLVPKIKLNFHRKQKDHIERLIKNTWDKKEVVGEFIQNQIQDDEISVNELIFQIQNDFCSLSNSNKFDAQIQDISVIRNLSQKYLPEGKRKRPDYIANAEALIFYFFEFCYIGAKTKKEKREYEQQSLFDW